MELLLNHETVLLNDTNLFESQDMVYISHKDNSDKKLDNNNESQDLVYISHKDDSDKKLDNNNDLTMLNTDQKDYFKQVH
jgi:hypothetical protein